MKIFKISKFIPSNGKKYFLNNYSNQVIQKNNESTENIAIESIRGLPKDTLIDISFVKRTRDNLDYS